MNLRTRALQATPLLLLALAFGCGGGDSGGGSAPDAGTDADADVGGMDTSPDTGSDAAADTRADTDDADTTPDTDVTQRPGLDALEGEPETPSTDAIDDYDSGTGPAASSIGTDDAGRQLSRTRLELELDETATVADVNALLVGQACRIVSSLAGQRFVVVEFADPGDLDGLDAKAAAFESEAAVVEVRKAYLPTFDVRPNNIPADNVFEYLGHLIATRAPAAWNAEAAATTHPTALVADAFGEGKTYDNILDATVPAGDYTGIGGTGGHGYSVLGVLAGLHGEAETPPPGESALVTGAFPGTLPLRLVDVRPDLEADATLDHPSLENRIVARANAMRDAGATRIVLNTSLNDSSTVGDLAETRKVARRWLEKVRGAGLEETMLHVTTAGNVKSDGIRDARTNSGYAAAALLASDQLGGDEPLTNVLVVENTFVIDSGAFCLAEESKNGGNIAAPGVLVFTITGPEGETNFLSGTSFSAPVVSGVAAYLWSIAPELDPQQLRDLLIDHGSTGSTGPSGSQDCDGDHAPAPMVDAFASLLALDAEAGTRARIALLDTDGSSEFDELDLAEIVVELVDEVPEAPDFDRFDFNGDGWTGGPRTTSFDLDMTDETTYQVPLGSVSVDFDESAVTDLAVVCYTAWDPSVYTGDPDVREALLGPHCVPPRIAFVTDRDGNAEIYTMNADGTDPVNLTNSSANEGRPRWSPDYSKIAYRSGGLVVMNADGTGTVEITTDFDGYFDWSPDGTKLAFTRNGSELWVADASGGGLTQLPFDTDVANDPSRPKWSPDGTTIAFTAYVTGASRDTDVFVVDATDGGGIVNLVNTPDYDEGPTWSPDGQQIAFLSQRNGSGQIFTVSVADPSVQTNLSQTDAGDSNYRWSPDGSRILFDRAGVGLMVMGSDGSGQTVLTDDGFCGAWSPTGDRVAFGGLAGGSSEIFSVASDGSGSADNLTASPAAEWDIAWSPVGTGPCGS